MPKRHEMFMTQQIFHPFNTVSTSEF